MPYIEEIARWQDNPEYNALPSPRKQVILENYFDKNIADDEFLKLPPERKSRIKSSFVKYHFEEAKAPSAVPIQPEESALDATGRVLGAGFKGAAEGLTTELPAMLGRAAEFVGSGIPGDITTTMRETTAEYGGDPSRVPDFSFDALRTLGEDLKDWAEFKRQQWFGPVKKREGLERIVYEGSKMLAPSILPAAIVGSGVRVLKGVGGLVKAAKSAELAGDVARAADLMDKANKAASLANTVASGATAAMFGFSQAQQTRETGEEQATLLESQGKFEEAKKVRANLPAAELATGTIEAAGEFFGTKYLGKFFRLDEAGVAKRGAKNLAKDFLKTLGVEVGTEIGQQLGQAYVEKETGIRPEADPVAEALDVIGPTVFMTLLTGGAAGAMDMAKQSTDSIDVLQEEQKKVTPDKDAVNVALIKKTLKEFEIKKQMEELKAEKTLKEFREEVTGPPSTAEDAASVLATKDEQVRIQEEREQAKLQRMGLRIPEEVIPASEAAEVFEEQLPEEPEEIQRLGELSIAEPPIGPPSTAEEAAEVFAREEDVDVQVRERLGLRPPAEKPAAESAEVLEETITRAANAAATSPTNDLPLPTEAQKESGTYQKGHVKIQGMDITIENPKGSERTGTDSDGETWSTTMQSHYGYIKGTVGKDKDHIDIFIGDHPDKENVYVVDQINPDTGEFDEHKVLIGFGNMREARKGYRENYEKGWKGLGAITKMSVEDFKQWAGDKAKTQQPLKYKEAKRAAQIRDDARRVLREEKRQLEKEKQKAITDKDKEKALRQRAEEVGDDIQRPEEAGRKARDRVEKYSVEAKVSPIGFYSTVQESVGKMDFKKAPASDIANRIKKVQGLKQEELEHLGVVDWLEGMGKDKVTKEQVQAFIEQGGVQVKEVVKSDERKRLDERLSEIDAQLQEATGKKELALKKEYDRLEKLYKEKYEDTGLSIGADTKFSQYTLPGGENYREVLLTLPTQLTAEEKELQSLIAKDWKGTLTEAEKERTVFLDKIAGFSLKQKAAKNLFKSPHFDEPNVLAHVRLNDRVDSEGRKTLFIEEIQSDWHQKGRKEGYRQPVDLQAIKIKQDKIFARFDKGEITREERNRAIDELDSEKQKAIGTPDAPFKASWPLLVFKRVLRMAAEQGYDAVAWTPGEVQADRYDLSKQVDAIRYEKKPDGTINLYADKGEELGVITKYNLQPNEIENYVGKEIAHKILEDKGKDSGSGEKSLSGLDLKVGGKGMNDFYDKMLPKIVEKYVRKLDKSVRVETAQVNLGSGVFKDMKGKDKEVWSLPLTDKIKAEVLQGQPLFRVGETEAGKKLRESIPYVGEEKRVAEKSFEGPEKRLQEPLTEAEREKIAKTGKYPAFPGEVPRTIDLVRTAFPGQQIKQTDTGFEVTLKNKLKVQIDRVAEIVPAGKERPIGREGEYIAGVYIRTPGGKTSQIKISTKAGVTTLHHESIHLLEDFGIITKQEAGRINRHIKQAKLWDKSKNAVENRAEWLANELNKPASNTKMRRIWAKIKDFIGNLVNKFGVRTVGGVVREIKTGEIFERPAEVEGKPTEQYAVERTGAPTEEDVDQPGLMRSQFDEFVYNQQDRFNYLNKAQMEAERKSRSELPEEQNTYQAETRWSGMAAAALEDFQGEYVDPLQEIMSDNDIGMDELDEYLHARHAKEANSRLMEINPDIEDNEALSGMTDEEANSILERISSSPQSGAYKELGPMVDRITKAHRDILRESGQESPETIKQWEDAYDFYVPLMREGKSEGKMPRRGRGFDVRGKQKIRVGSTRRAVNILAHTVANTEAAIIRTEKLKVARTFLEFARNNEGPWEIDTVEYKPRFNAEGIIVYRPDPLYRDADNVMIVKEGGINHRIVFDESNLNAMRIASALKNLDAADSGTLVRTLSKAMRWLAIVNTSANVEFLFTNPVRDLGTAFYNMSDSEADAVKWATIREIPQAWKGMRQFQKGNKSTEWAKWYDRFRKAGGKTGWLQGYSNILELQGNLEKSLKNMKAGKPLTIKRGLKSAVNYIGAMNDIGENGIRLSLFKNLVESGVKEGRAAFIAKEVTVNFNRKGAKGQLMNSLYLFYNASIGGSARIIKAATKSAKVRKLMAGTVVFAAGLDMLNRAIGGVDDGEDRYDKIPDWEKERNLILMYPDSTGYAKLALPWGYNVLHVIGQVIGEQFTKKDADPVKGAMRIAGATISSFNPVGGEASILQVLSPTITDPIVQWAENKDWAGRKLRPDSNVFTPKPSSQTYWNSVREPSKLIAEKLNELTGGDVVKPGAIDISPEAIDLMIDAFTGGAGKFLGNVVSTPIKAFKGEEIESFEIPILRRVYGKIGKQALTSDFYENMDAVQLVYRQLKHYKDDKKKIEEIKAESSQEIRSIRAMKATKKALRLLRKGKKLAMKIQNTQRRKKKLEAINIKIKLVMRNFNKRYKHQEREE